MDGQDHNHRKEPLAQRCPFALWVTVLLLVLAGWASWMFRYDVTPSAANYLKLDRWTGVTYVCFLNGYCIDPNTDSGPVSGGQQ